uniref:cellulase n=1 Tax=Desulfacinum infernum TaxID=35837 RepID=A0A832EAZ1_9BACT
MCRILSAVFTVLCLGVMGLQQVRAADVMTWEAYKERFVSDDGRVIDRANKDISHSEGQGYGLILALAAGDKPGFQKIWDWTRNNLQVRGRDRLLAWAWGRRPNGSWNVLDLNNATDGDLLVAFALLTAHERWNVSEWQAAARALIQDVKNHLLVETPDFPVLLPGYYGFVNDRGIIVNPSYYVYPALKMFSRHDDGPLWDKVFHGGLKLLDKARRTSWNLPGDWIIVLNDRVELYRERSSRFGYEAIRTLLYLSWVENRDRLRTWTPVLDWFDKTGTLPVWVDLLDPALSLDEAPGGFYGVWARVARMLDRPETARKLQARAQEKVAAEKDDYYSNTLYLLSQISFEKP